MGLPTQVVLDKGPLNGYVCVCLSVSSWRWRTSWMRRGWASRASWHWRSSSTSCSTRSATSRCLTDSSSISTPSGASASTSADSVCIVGRSCWCLCVSMGLCKRSYSAWFSCSPMQLLCFYCLFSRILNKITQNNTHTPFVRDYLGEPVPER